MTSVYAETHFSEPTFSNRIEQPAMVIERILLYAAAGAMRRKTRPTRKIEPWWSEDLIAIK